MTDEDEDEGGFLVPPELVPGILRAMTSQREGVDQAPQDVRVTLEIEKELLEQMKRLNANLELLCAMVQSSLVAEALEVAKDIRFLLAKLTGHRVK